MKRRQVDGYRYCVGSYKVIATTQLDFVSAKYQYVYYSNIAMDTESAMECRSNQNHIRTWQDGERRRPSGVGGRNEDHGSR